MHVNDVGVTYHTYSDPSVDDLMFCAPCAMKITASVVQDLCRIDEDKSMGNYLKFKDPQHSLLRHAAAFDAMANKMRVYAEAVAYANGTAKVKE
jgi:hypothetical protein